MRVRTPKRGTGDRAGVMGWHQYYAGFSADFVRDVLEHMNLRKGSIVVDPMNGVGTTTLVAQELGHLAIGLDINPGVCLIAAAKDASVPRNEASINQIFRLVRRTRPTTRIQSDAAEWMPPLVAQSLTALVRKAASEAWPRQAPLHSRLREIFPRYRVTNDVRHGLPSLLAAIPLVALRRLCPPISSSNPSWPMPTQHHPWTKARLRSELELTLLDMWVHLTAVFPHVSAKRRLAVACADARDIPLPDESVDAVVTSPPYLTRLDYAVATRPELSLLIPDDARQRLRSSQVGSVRTRGRADDNAEIDIGRRATRVLGRISRHTSKASSGYYARFFRAYFRDAARIAGEYMRILQPGGTLALVVQDSWYKNIRIPLARVYEELTAMHGARCIDSHKELVTRYLTQINTAASAHEKGRVHEHVLLLRKG